MKLKPDKRYIRRDGKITGKLVELDGGSQVYKFIDPNTLNSYITNGSFWISGKPCNENLVEEYVEDQDDGMTVGELINVLKYYNKELKINVYDWDYCRPWGIVKLIVEDGQLRMLRTNEEE